MRKNSVTTLIGFCFAFLYLTFRLFKNHNIDQSDIAVAIAVAAIGYTAKDKDDEKQN